jgi:5-methylcytosine-specific restriction enzyme A
MLRTIKHGINLLRHSLRDVGISAKRSAHWPTIEKHFREKYPTCAACGGSKRLNVHHIQPFHIFPELELDTNNLISLCMGKLECHLRLGHLGNFKTYNPNIIKNAAAALKHPDRFDKIAQEAFANRKAN